MIYLALDRFSGKGPVQTPEVAPDAGAGDELAAGHGLSAGAVPAGPRRGR